MWKGIIKAIVGVAIGIFGITSINTTLSTIDTTTMLPATRNMISVFPLLYAALVIVGIFQSFVGIQEVVVYYKWEAFGNRLKEAYVAKFGYSNSGFNEEVDTHILGMRTMGGKSPTKEMYEDWLKRMARFVEVPFAVPEEEHLSEEEKTEQFTETDGEEETELASVGDEEE